MEIECIEKTRVWATGVVGRVHQRLYEGWQVQVDTKSWQVRHNQIKPIKCEKP